MEPQTWLTAIMSADKVLPASQNLCKNAGEGSSAPASSAPARSAPAPTVSDMASVSASATTLVPSDTSTNNKGGSRSHTSVAAQSSGPSGAVDPNNSSPWSASLGKAAIAGIVLGSVTGAMLMAAGAWWIGRHRAADERNKRTHRPIVTDSSMHTTDASVVTRGPVYLAGGTPLSGVADESRGQKKTHELPAQTH